MRKLLNNPWFVALAALVALLMVGRSVLSAMGGPAASPVLSAAPMPVVAEDTSEEVAPSPAVSEALQALAAPGAVRDPFAVPAKAVAVAEPVALPDLIDRVHLSAIWTQGNATLVLINERILVAGDEIGRVKIESASQEGVWVTHWKGRDFINLGAEFVLNTPATRAEASAL